MKAYIYDSGRPQFSDKKLFRKYLENIQEHICIGFQLSLSYKFRETKYFGCCKTCKISSRAYIFKGLFKWANLPGQDFQESLFREYSGLSPSRLLSISNFSLFRTKSSVPWTFTDSVSYFYLFISNFSISNFSLFRTKILAPFDYFSLYLELFLFKQQTERKCSIFENSNVIKTFEIQKFDCNQNIIKVFLN